MALVCPYCNSVLTADANGAAPATCPRCDAKLAAEAIRAVAAGPPPVAPRPSSATAPGRWTTLLLLLGVMALVATGSAIYIWNSQKTRRDHDFKTFPKKSTSEPATTEPGGEPSLVGWLPAKCTIVAAVRFADLRKNVVANRALLSGEMPRRIESLGRELESLTTLKLDDLDEFVLGLEPGETVPRLYMILQSIRPVDAAARLARTDMSRGEKVRGRAVGRFGAYNVVEGLVWPIDERRTAIVLRMEPGPLIELEAIPERQRPKLEGNSETLRKLVAELPSPSLAWIAGAMSKNLQSDVFDGLPISTGELQPLLEAKAFRVSLSADDDDMTLQGALLMPSTEKMTALKSKIEALDWRGLKSPKVEVSSADAPPWAFVQVRYDAAGLREVIQNAIGAKGR